jgi:hypothetical protein
MGSPKRSWLLKKKNVKSAKEINWGQYKNAAAIFSPNLPFAPFILLSCNLS